MAEETVAEIKVETATEADDVESDEDIRLVGRPRLSLLDTLTVEVQTPRGVPRKY